jgi:hypothetical protein
MPALMYKAKERLSVRRVAACSQHSRDKLGLSALYKGAGVQYHLIKIVPLIASVAAASARAAVNLTKL